jgi:hypothetical protein
VGHVALGIVRNPDHLADVRATGAEALVLDLEDADVDHPPLTPPWVTGAGAAESQSAMPARWWATVRAIGWAVWAS